MKIHANKVTIFCVLIVILCLIIGISSCRSAAPTSISPTASATGVIPPPVSAPQPGSSVTLPSPSPSALPPGSTPAQASPVPSTPPSASAAASNIPIISITSPRDGASLAAGNITVTAQVTNFNIVDKIGQPNVPGQGHIIYYLDMVPPQSPGTKATTSPGTFIASAGTSNLWKNVQAGQHSFTAQLVNNDDTPLDPQIWTGVIVNVKTGQSAVIDLIAQNISFNLTTITVPAGAQVTINFSNKDSGIPHNLDIFQSKPRVLGIFTGHSITGVSTIVYKFTAPTVSGTYNFQCDFHPLQMNGAFVITQP